MYLFISSKIENNFIVLEKIPFELKINFYIKM